MIVNKSPILTNEGYKINYIDLNIKVPNNSSEFKNIKIDSKNFKLLNKNIGSLDYKLSEEIYSNNKEYNNHKFIGETTNKSNIEIVYDFDDKNTNLINYIEINALHNTDITFIYKSNTSDYNFLNSILKINVLNQSNVNINIVNLLNNLSNCFLNVESHIKINGKINFNIIDFGGLNSISNIYLNALEDNSSGKINTIYMANNNELKDINYISCLHGKKSIIDMNVEGTLSDLSKKNFKGTIDFKKGSVKSIGEENENCVLLSDNAISKALPILLCSEEDVSGAHSASAGKIDNEQIYYLMTRGINKKEAVKLIINGKFYKVINRIKNEEYKKMIMDEINRRL